MTYDTTPVYAFKVRTGTIPFLSDRTLANDQKKNACERVGVAGGVLNVGQGCVNSRQN